MSTVNGFQVGNEVLKYNYESLENYNTPNFSTSSSTQYAVGDYVTYQGKLYKCTTATTGGTWVSGSWELAILSDDLQSLGSEVEDLNQQLTQIATITISPNLYNAEDPDVLTDKYLNPNGVLETYSGRTVTGFIPVTVGQKVVMSLNGTEKDFSAICFYQSNKTTVVSGGAYNTNRLTVPDNAAFARITLASSYTNVQIECNANGDISAYVPYGQTDKAINSDVKIPGISPYKKPFAVVTGDLGNNDFFKLLETRISVRKNQRVVFTADVTSFTSITIGKTSDVGTTINNKETTFIIDGTNITYYFSGTTTPSEQVAHGLTISENIQVIIEESNTNTCKVTLISDGSSFDHVFGYRIYIIGAWYVLSASTLTNCSFVWSCVDFDRNTWIFGDSYVQYFPERWPYYLAQYGYDKNALIDGYSGEGSMSAYPSFKTLLQYSTPKTAIWCLGMNDLSDSENTPSANWVTGRDEFLSYCANNDIMPIFATIPTVPSINHEAKNAWIRSSGYRYIDFAKAVGATASGTWFAGMLSEDNIHPTVKGAKALFAQFLCDYPEIMIGAESTPIVEQANRSANLLGNQSASETESEIAPNEETESSTR